MNFALTPSWKNFFQFSLVVLSACGLFQAQAQAQAQAFPTKPVKLVVTYPPGGSSDLMARIMGQKSSAKFGVSLSSSKASPVRPALLAWSSQPVNLPMATPL